MFSSDDDFTPVELEVPSTHVNPGNDYAPPPAVIPNPDVLIKVAEAQRRMTAANIAAGGADLGIGGELILVELTRQGFTIKKAHRFADYAQVKEMLRHGR